MGVFFDKLAGWLVKGYYDGSPSDGSTWQYNSSNKYWEIRSQPFSSTSSSTAISNTTTESSLTGTGLGSLTLPSNFFTVGSVLRINSRGVISTQAVPVTLNIKVKVGSTTVLTTGAQTPAGSLVNRYFEIDGVIVCRSVGSSGSLFSQGKFILSFTANDAGLWDMENTSNASIDTTSSQLIDITATWGAGVSATDSLTGSITTVERLT